MAEEQKNTNVSPAQPVQQNQNIAAQTQPQVAPTTPPKQAQAEAPKPVRTSALIQNPPVPEEPKQRDEELAVPQATLNEMEAGRRALERNKPVFVAREQAAQDAVNVQAAHRQG